MAAPPSAPESKSRPGTVQTRPDSRPDGAADVMTRSLQVGAGIGAFGALMGASTGIVIGTKHPMIFTLLSGFQWFAHGSIYYGSRHMILSRHGPVNTTTPLQKLEASSLGGAISGGTVMGLIRGRNTILISTILGTLLGGGGQLAVNLWAASSKAEKKSDGWFTSRWSPLTKLTDQEYENILEEKLLRLDAEIAIIDDNIAVLRTQKQDQAKAMQEKPQTPSSKGQA